MTFDPIKLISEWAIDLLKSFGLNDGLITVIGAVSGVFTVSSIILGLFIFLTWLERKVAARFQDRIGPNRVGWFGLLQPIADALKMVTKEDTTPDGADKVAYNIAPILTLISVLLMWAVIPFSNTWIGTDLNVGVLYIAAVGTFGVVSILMAGWASNNKYALLGAFRAVAQLVSYEVPLFMSMLVPVFLARSMGVNDIVVAQEGFKWFVIVSPLAFIIFFISSLAEIGRTPFDLLEAESEIVAGYHIEYSGMKFGMFQAGEFIHSFTAAALMGLLFFGGWNPAGADAPLIGALIFFAKTFFFYFIIMWIRSTLPRIRIDHMMAFGWKFLVPNILVLLMFTPILDYFVSDMGWIRVGAHFSLNMVILLISMQLSRNSFSPDRMERVKFEARPLAVPPKEEEAAV
ncbi:MAG: NADH-quinone oxidoreductase subunit NuoH [Chloroflexota bacterium]